MRPSRSTYLPIRDLSYHVRCWGDPAAPKLIMLHGWMDVSASFQFLVDALQGEWNVLAPDWRGYGLTEWPQDGYWFHDYLADLDALVEALSPDAPVNLIGHSLGGNVSTLYAGLRPARVRRMISLEGFGVPAGTGIDAPGRLLQWLDALRNPQGFRPFASFAEAADRLQKTNPRLTRERAEFLAQHWAVAHADGSVHVRGDPKHKLPFPTVSRTEDWTEVWKRTTAPVMWVLADQTNIKTWANKTEEEWQARLAAVPGLRFEMVTGAGHMLHHDQPEQVARLIEDFVAD